jgi:hypothetical protein
MEEFFAFLGLIMTPTAVALGVAFAFTRAEVKRLREERKDVRRGDGLDRFDRLEQAVDAIAGEVERLAQSQQYTARLLSGREEAARREAPRPDR